MEKFTLNQQENKNPNQEGIEKHKGFIEHIKSKINNFANFSVATGGFATGAAIFIGEGIAENNASKAAVGVGATIAGIFTFLGAATGKNEVKNEIDARAEYLADDDAITTVHLN